MTRNLKFYKDETSRWFVDLPEWDGDKADLEMVMGADDMLDVLAQGAVLVNVLVSTEPIEDYIVKLTFLRDESDGGWYSVKHSTINYDNFEAWLCKVTVFIFGELPKEFYIA